MQRKPGSCIGGIGEPIACVFDWEEDKELLKIAEERAKEPEFVAHVTAWKPEVSVSIDPAYLVCRTDQIEKAKQLFQINPPTPMFSFFNKDQKILREAGFMNGEAELTLHGREAFIHMMLEDKELMKQFVAKAKEQLDDA